MTTPQQPDHAQTAKVYAQVAERSRKILGDFLKRQADGKGIAFTDEFGLAKAYMDLAAKMLANPWKLAESQMKMFWDYLALWQSSTLKMMGHGAEPVVHPDKGDTRWRDEERQNHFLFAYFKQSYLFPSHGFGVAGVRADGVSRGAHTRGYVFFRQYIDALS